jgi:hypothetical protein
MSSWIHPYKKITGMIGCSIYKELKAVEYLNRFDNTIHKEV